MIGLHVHLLIAHTQQNDITIKRVRSLIVISDSHILINMIKAKESRPGLFGILFDIYHFSLSFDVMSCHFMPHLCNDVADKVATSALTSLNSSSVDGE